MGGAAELLMARPDRLSGERSRPPLSVMLPVREPLLARKQGRTHSHSACPPSDAELRSGIVRLRGGGIAVIPDRRPAPCPGPQRLSRRDLLQVGFSSALGLSLPGL